MPLNELGTCGKRGRDEGVRAEGGPMMRGGMGDSREMAGEREGMGRRRGTFTTMLRHIRIRLGGCNVLHWEWYVSVRSCYAIVCNVHIPALNSKFHCGSACFRLKMMCVRFRFEITISVEAWQVFVCKRSACFSWLSFLCYTSGFAHM